MKYLHDINDWKECINQVVCGDCLEGMKLIPDNSVNTCFTSPPYNRKRNDKYSNYDDTLEDYFRFLCEITDEMIRICDGNIFVNLQKNYYNKTDVYKYIGKYSDKIQDIIIWEKLNPMPANGKNITNSYEFFIVLGALKSNFTYTKNILSTSVNNETRKDHKALMHIDVAKWFMQNFTHKGDIIFDPFMGCYTTARACKDLGRNFIGFELVEEYCRIGESRLEQQVLFN